VIKMLSILGPEISEKDRDKIMQGEMVLCEYRGYRLSLPYQHLNYVGLRLWKNKKDYSVIIGSSFHPGEEVLLECSCCYDRWFDLDQVIDHLEEGCEGEP
jgi:hypothetical protein